MGEGKGGGGGRGGRKCTFLDSGGLPGSSPYYSASMQRLSPSTPTLPCKNIFPSSAGKTSCPFTPESRVHLLNRSVVLRLAISEPNDISTAHRHFVPSPPLQQRQPANEYVFCFLVERKQLQDVDSVFFVCLFFSFFSFPLACCCQLCKLHSLIE